MELTRRGLETEAPWTGDVELILDREPMMFAIRQEVEVIVDHMGVTILIGDTEFRLNSTESKCWVEIPDPWKVSEVETFLEKHGFQSI